MTEHGKVEAEQESLKADLRKTIVDSGALERLVVLREAGFQYISRRGRFEKWQLDGMYKTLSQRAEPAPVAAVPKPTTDTMPALVAVA
jgi:hypothetical protein